MGEQVGRRVVQEEVGNCDGGLGQVSIPKPLRGPFHQTVITVTSAGYANFSINPDEIWVMI